MEPEQGTTTATGTEAGTALEARPKDQKHRGAITTALAIGAVLLEPELLPGIAIGVAVVALPKYFPTAMARLRPLTDRARKAAGEAVTYGRDLGGKTRGIGQKALELGQKVGSKTKERIAHVVGRTAANGAPSGSPQPA